METVYLNAANLEYWKNKSKSNVMALGFFDGMHKGHQKVVKTAIQKAKAYGVSVAVMSFFPHPKTVLSKEETTFDYIMPLTEKGKVLESLGVDTFYIVEFDASFASLTPKEYVFNYLVDFGVVHAVAGYDFSYGQFGAGHIDRLEKDSNGKLEVTKVAKVEHKGEKISSTWIREVLYSGNMETLPHLLGRPYEMECKWKGASFEPLPQYTIPAPGCYEVTISDGYNMESANVEVSEEKDFIHCLEFNGSTVNRGDQVSMVWHRRVPYGALSYSY